MIAVITRLEVRSLLHLPRFFKYAIPSAVAAKQANGNVFASTKPLNWRTHCTLTIWEDMQAMLSFISSEPHLIAMKISRRVASDTAYWHWETDHIPTWEEALKMLQEASSHARS